MLAIRQTVVLFVVAAFILLTIVAVELTGQAEPAALWLGRSVLVTLLLCMAVVGVVASPEPQLSVWVRALKGFVLWSGDRSARTVAVVLVLLGLLTTVWLLGPRSIEELSFRCRGVTHVTWRNWSNRLVGKPCSDFLQVDVWRPLTTSKSLRETIYCRAGSERVFPPVPEAGDLRCVSIEELAAGRIYSEDLVFPGEYRIGKQNGRLLFGITAPVQLHNFNRGTLKITSVRLRATVIGAGTWFSYDSHLICGSPSRLLPPLTSSSDWHVFKASLVDEADHLKGLHISTAIPTVDGANLIMWRYEPAKTQSGIDLKHADLEAISAADNNGVACQVFVWTGFGSGEPAYGVTLKSLTVQLNGTIAS